MTLVVAVAVSRDTEGWEASPTSQRRGSWQTGRLSVVGRAGLTQAQRTVGSGAGLAYIPRSIAPSSITLASGRMAGATRPGCAPSEKGRLLWMDWTP